MGLLANLVQAPLAGPTEVDVPADTDSQLQCVESPCRVPL